MITKKYEFFVNIAKTSKKIIEIKLFNLRIFKINLEYFFLFYASYKY